MQETIELQEGLFVESHVIDLLNANFTFAQAIFDSEFWKAGIMLLAGEPFLLGGGNDPAVAHEAGGAIVVKS